MRKSRSRGSSLSNSSRSWSSALVTNSIADTYGEDKVLVNVSLADVGVEVHRLDEAQEELVNDLEVGPGEFQYRLILFRVICIAGGVDLRRDRSEQIGGELIVSRILPCIKLTYHANHLGIDRLRDNPPRLRDVLEHLMQCLRLDLLPIQVRARVVEVKDDTALLQLLDEEFRLLLWSDLYLISSIPTMLYRDLPSNPGSFSISTFSDT